MIFAGVLAVVLGISVGYDRLRPRTKQGGGSEFVSVALLLAIVRSLAHSPSQAALIGALFGLGYAGWMLSKLLLPIPVSAALLLSQLLVWTVFILGSWRLLGLPFPLNVAAIACLGTSLFWLEWTLLPLWGTAQNFACSSPKSPAFISLFGTAGGVWATLCYSGLYAHVIPPLGQSVPTSFFIQLLLWGAGFFVLLRALDALAAIGKPQTLRVATLGWAGTQFDALSHLPNEYQSAARQASENGARLLVTPEAAIHVQDRAHFRVAICTLAQRYNLALAIGYFDHKQNRNCIDLVTAQGEVVGRYVKTHLVPVFERYTRGNGEIALMEVDGIKVGGLICQDDNFPDVARKYGKAGTQLLVVPTNDWKKIKDIHFANHLWRALECRYALARAASEGISALTSADGKVEKFSDHFKDGTKLLIADLRVGSGRPTLYAQSGDIFPIVCAVAALCGLFGAR
ncbi:hypothetical protein EON83_07815 [bacterium]|nr:MAG: hypothetical protein EON83_07815 [bacterium]